MSEKRWFDSKIVVSLFLVLLYPFGVILFFMSKKKPWMIFLFTLLFWSGIIIFITNTGEAKVENVVEKSVKPVKKVAKTIKELRQEKINSLFSGWDGSHYKLKKLIRDNCKNPKSFKHVNTSYIDKGGYLIVQMSYRAANSYNAIIPGIITVKSDLRGNIIEIIEQ